nr:Chain A, Lectin [Colocasia esculenta]5T1X_C Chain C, Lectin [Colocasia esculenta]5T1X_E Chain E, Lectin [Colocasia esculenta]5T1X_G Chain G, Lectin [Colocasia esculenta]5T20_A Chain A, Lectin [Colocasia esculenta]5T20_C Chain C, Lectin [Colocasia esculenta]5T20_E Chain E, Lectin [Colocasia esculenta]5T20_G Chain G, Lectin [Colocasia esculenta]5T20_I Chain I, Lectin [Colocasia esculenta]5T20_K Chain K, Lectin [Colocasia esculenta]5T20_M Chain M, Lectin [Colocasia esculenta]5T20_O Chain
LGTNYLLSGQTLNTDGHLKNGDFDLVMQNDCNLVLYNGNWQSNTANNGRDCKLTLTDYGELVIKNGDGSTVWRSRAKSVKGNYAAVLHPDGRLVVFGPSVFKIDPWVPGL